MIPVIKTASPQAAEIYELLNNGQTLNAQEIADKLGILPNAVYRVAKKLTDIGLVEQVDDYPVRFKAVPAQTALSLYLVVAAQNFRREFGLASSPKTKTDNSPIINLIKDRPSLLKRTAADARASRESIDFIVSGHGVDDETFLAYRKAATLRVPIRRIVHQKEQAKNKWTDMWKEIGANVRYLPDFEMRMFIYDKRIVYITSYDSSKHGSAFGVRFEYVPLALQMTELFEQNWQKAKQL
jgi:hypothetical protein